MMQISGTSKIKIKCSTTFTFIPFECLFILSPDPYEIGAYIDRLLPETSKLAEVTMEPKLFVAVHV